MIAVALIFYFILIAIMISFSVFSFNMILYFSEFKQKEISGFKYFIVIVIIVIFSFIFLRILVNEIEPENLKGKIHTSPIEKFYQLKKVYYE